MHGTELLADGLKRSFDMLNMTLSDFSDADMFARPCPGANHPTWQLGHLLEAEFFFIDGVAPGKLPPLPASFKDKFTKETAKVDDPKAFPKKEELLSAFSKMREATIAWFKTLTPADLDKPTTMPKFAPTVGHLAIMMPIHDMMHTGQFQVARRKLGKPVMF